jgi:hypothetical protein
MGVRLNQIDDVFETRIEELGCQHEPDRQQQHGPARDVESQERRERRSDDAQADLHAEVRLVLECLTDPVDRVGDGVTERALANR